MAVIGDAPVLVPSPGPGFVEGAVVVAVALALVFAVPLLAQVTRARHYCAAVVGLRQPGIG